MPGKRVQGKQFPKGSTTLAVAQDTWWAQLGISPEEFLSLSAKSQRLESQRPVLPCVLQSAVGRYCSLTVAEISETSADLENFAPKGYRTCAQGVQFTPKFGTTCQGRPQRQASAALSGTPQ